MATITVTQPIPVLPPLPASDEVYRFTVEQFDRMVEDGTLDEDEPVELLNGILVTKMPKNSRHRVIVLKVVEALQGLIPEGWYVQKEESVVISPKDKWEPDVAVIRSALKYDFDRDALGTDAGLIVEVADSNLARAYEKRVGYAAAGIPVYWIVNVGARRIEVSSGPTAGSYPPPTIHGEADQIEVIIDGRVVGRITVADLLPRRS